MLCAFLTVNRDPPEYWTTNKDGTRPQCQRLEHIGSPTNTAVKIDFAASRHCFGDFGQCFDSRQRTIELPSPVIGDDNALDASLDCQQGIFRRQDALSSRG